MIWGVGVGMANDIYLTLFLKQLIASMSVASMIGNFHGGSEIPTRQFYTLKASHCFYMFLLIISTEVNVPTTGTVKPFR